MDNSYFNQNVPCCNHHNNKNKPTITKVSDNLWNMISNLLPTEKPNNMVGRPVVPYRKVFNGIVYVLRTRCQWKMLRSEFGSGSTCHRRFQQWIKIDIFKKMCIRLLKEYDHKKEVSSGSDGNLSIVYA